MSEPAVAPVASRRFGPWRSELLAFAELFAICGLAVAQPMFDVAGKNTEIFSTRRTSPSELVAFTLIVLLVPSIVLYVVELVAAFALPRARPLVHAGLVGLAVAVLAEEALKHATELGRLPLIGAGTVAGVVVAVLVLRFDFAQTFLRFLTVAPPVFAALFLVASPIRPVVFDQAGAQAADVRIDAPHRVVWIVFDELPLTSLLDGGGHVDRDLFPNFAELAGDATWYRNSVSVAPFTSAAVPAMLTGNMPTDENRPATATNYPHNIFTLLGKPYAMHVRETLTVMCPKGICHDALHGGTVQRGLAPLLHSATGLYREFASPHRKPPGLDVIRGVMALDADPAGTATAWVDGIRRSSAPQLDFLHVLLPHWAWHYRSNLQDDGESVTPSGLAADRWTTPWVTTAARQRHLLQVQATDTILGRVTARLRRIGAWDDSLVVVTADHGVGFAPGEPARGLGATNVPDVVWTPLFIKYPGQTAGTIDDRAARTVDVLPTVADALGIRLPWPVDGHTLRGPVRRDDPTRVFHWKIDARTPRHGKFNVVGRSSNFAKALKARASAASGDPTLRIYRAGPDGALIGLSVAGLVEPGRADVSVSVKDRTRFSSVDPAARVAPWLYASGAAAPGRDGVRLAVAVNGTVAAVTETVGAPGAPAAPWWASLPPQFFRAGSNDIRVYEIVGPSSGPRLRAVAGA